MTKKLLLTTTLAAAATLVPLIGAFATELDLSGSATSGSLVADFGGTALFSEIATHTAGTGVYDPFLTLQSPGSDPIESGYNTDGHTALYLDQQRPEWNTRLTLGDLAVITIGGAGYYAFELDANEPNGAEQDGSAKSLISIDNIRIYTSSTDNTAAVGSDESKLEDPSPLGTLRFALNNPLKNGNYKFDNWVKLEAATDGIADLQGHNGGSGFSDLIVYIPVVDFAGASPSDYVWFYNLNGVHFDADVSGTAAQAGYEEWRAVTGTNAVSDGGNTAALLGLALVALAFSTARRTRTMKTFKRFAAIAVTCASLGLASQLSALTVGDDHDLGLISKNQPADPTSSALYINVLLDQALGSGPTTITTPNGFTNDYTRTNNDPLGGLYPDAVFNVDLGASTTINLGNGYLYLLAKYDGPNYGSEVWYVGDLGGTITIPSTAGQYGLSHVYLFNGSGGTGLPDAGSTIMLLGIALSGLGALRRFSKA